VTDDDGRGSGEIDARMTIRAAAAEDERVERVVSLQGDQRKKRS
jgi:hypothetical protein